MGAPESGLEAAGQATADTLLTAFRTIKAPERARHASVLDYWLSIRGDKEFPPLHDLDPLEISDAGPGSILLELIGGGQDAEIRHLGEALSDEAGIQRIIDAPNPSILACIAKKLPIVAISRDFLAFEDSFDSGGGWTRCWVTLLPLSSCGSWVDYVYAFVSVETGGAKAVKAGEPAAPAELELVEEAPAEQPEAPETASDSRDIEAEEATAKGGPGFSRLVEGIASLTGFYGQGVKAEDVVNISLPSEEPLAETEVDDALAAEQAAEADADPEELILDTEAPEPVAEVPEAVEASVEIEPERQEILPEPVAEGPEAAEVPDPVAEEPEIAEVPAEIQPEPEEAAPQPAPAMEGKLQSKLAEVQAKADEAREAQLRATQALHQGLSAAYDFALDAESAPEEYLRLVEAQGLKIQLRAPMAPVAKLAFNDICDAATIRQFEAVLAWALKVELPRGALLERIEQAGGIPELLNEFARAA